MSLQNDVHCIEVLDDGFVRLVDSMGDDAAIVQAARTSYGKGTKKVNEDRGLIRYLMRNWHTTPFEMVELKFHVRVPMDCWRQWIRHRMASVNEYSTRYSEAIDSAQQTDDGAWRLQAASNRQGSSGFVGDEWPEGWTVANLAEPASEDASVMWVVEGPQGFGDVFWGKQAPTPAMYLTQREDHALGEMRSLYQERLALGVAREQARKDLPLSTYTEAYWKIDLHNLFHFLRLRMDSHAQKEIRDFAEAIFSLIQPVVPLACEAFQDYRLDAMQLSGPEIKRLRYVLNADPAGANAITNKCELQEFMVKAELIGAAGHAA